MSPVSSWNGPDPRGGEWGFPVSTPWPPGPLAPPPPPVQRPVTTTVPSESGSEPVIIAHSITVILGAVVTAGWMVIPSPTINAIATVVGFVASTVGAVLARSKVSPVKDGIWSAIERHVSAVVAEERARLR